MNKKIFGGIAIVAIAVAVVFNVSLSKQTPNQASQLVLANVEALAQNEVIGIENVLALIEGLEKKDNEVSDLGKWWNTSKANLTGFKYIGRESYGKNVYNGYSVTHTPAITTDSWSVGLPSGVSVGSQTSRPYTSESPNYVYVMCCRDSYKLGSCSNEDADWRC